MYEKTLFTVYQNSTNRKEMIAPKTQASTLLLWVLSSNVSLIEGTTSPIARNRWRHYYNVGCGSKLGVAEIEHDIVPFRQDIASKSRYVELLNAIRGGDETETVQSSTSLPSSKKKKKKRTDHKSSKTASESDADSSQAPQKENQVPKKQKKPKVSKAARAHVEREIKSTSPNYRIQRELKEFIRDPPPGLSVQIGKNLRVWIVTVHGPGIYEGETFRLRISFPPQYPTVPPSVYFLQPDIPVGPHFYTNGDICLSLLGKDWRPTMTAQSIAISILSMLASVPKKTLPMDNAAHAQNKPGQYQKDWVYHDDNC